MIRAKTFYREGSRYGRAFIDSCKQYKEVFSENQIFFTIATGAISALAGWGVYINRKKHNEYVESRLNEIQENILTLPVKVEKEKHVTNWRMIGIVSSASFISGIICGLFLGRARYKFKPPTLISTTSTAEATKAKTKKPWQFEPDTLSLSKPLAVTKPFDSNSARSSSNSHLSDIARKEALSLMPWKSYGKK